MLIRFGIHNEEKGFFPNRVYRAACGVPAILRSIHDHMNRGYLLFYTFTRLFISIHKITLIFYRSDYYQALA